MTNTDHFDTDILHIGDFTSEPLATRVSEQLRTQADHGYHTRLIHVPSRVVHRPVGWHDSIVSLLHLPNVSIGTEHSEVRTQVAIIHGPRSVESSRATFSSLEANLVVVIVSAADLDESGAPSFAPDLVDSMLREAFGEDPRWTTLEHVPREALIAEGALHWLEGEWLGAGSATHETLTNLDGEDAADVDSQGQLRGTRLVSVNPAREMEHVDQLTALGVHPRAKPAGYSRPYGQVGEGSGKRILFVTSNGAGMGHLTRLLAIATRLPERTQPIFASLSKGVEIVSQYGIPYEYIGSRDGLGMRTRDWNEYLDKRFDRTLSAIMPHTVVFDGVWPYRGVRNAVRQRGIRSIWMRRPMWKAGVSTRPLEWTSEFDQIIEPGEFASAYDAGPTSLFGSALRLDPVTLLSSEDLLSRTEARARLGYGKTDHVALITLGAGNINDIGDLQNTILEWFGEHAPHWRVVMTKPPIAHSESLNGVKTLQVFPLASYTNAFDFAVSASGYNAFHEWMIGELPTIWVPNDATKTDDQVARARWAQDQGLGLYVPEGDGEAMRSALAQMVNFDVDRMRIRLRCLPKVNGAPEAAATVDGDRDAT